MEALADGARMAVNMLSELNPHGLNWNIRVCISRMWEFCDKDTGNIKHLDLVIVDEKNNAMYVEIPPEEISQLKNHLNEGKIVDIKRFLVQKTKNIHKVFPKYVFNLIPFSEIKQHAGLTNRFPDVIGYVAAVSNIARAKFGHGKFQPKRTIILKNERGQQVRVSLLGPRALEFDADKVYNEGQRTPIITIFVGTLAKTLGAEKTLVLSGSSACCWYINEDILAIHEFYARYKLSLMGSDDTYELEFVLFNKKAEQLVGKSVDKLLNINDKNFIPAEITGLIG
ncbi:hypothetical protein C2845_PM17G10820 [Panicum miliaceum]|uniref:Replication protein A 70 kDa DNA-binding subunit B/D first OB fold domain-containing protein n=1 Tax=Panicum miliaceum TaxID=4540 RepID=A0A3L6Q0E6_PANMI|nr:hypothetical protein C2845_PM17G10820 [Panicum miliaceum]